MKLPADFPHGWIISNNSLKRVFFSHKEQRESSAGLTIESFICSYKCVEPFTVEKSKADLILDRGCILFPNAKIILEMAEKDII